MDVNWVNIEYELGKVEEYDRKSDQSIDKISIGSTTIKIYFNHMSKREDNYIRVILIENLLGYEYPVVRGESI
jgi:hypothetical protein